jgi:chemotaxis protein methyltransferase WspC
MKSHFHIEPLLLKRIVQRLADAAGIDPASLEERRMAWTIERRCRHLHLQGPSAYLDHLESSTAELEDLIDALVIHETRFFRDPAVFDHLRVWAQGIVASCPGPLRALSAPCSTGQEAYSVAAILRCSGIGSFSIDAFDISHTAVAVAQSGVYPARALDDVPADLKAACGTLENQQWHMGDELRSRIRFKRRNLADASALASEPGYHLILCRNLFIYLHAGARAILARSLCKALLPGGRLIVGVGDRVAELNARFTAVHPGAGFELTHKAPAPPVIALSAAPPDPPVHTHKKRIPRFALPTRKSEDHSAPTTAVEFHRRAMEYKERGNDREAERCCRQALYLAPACLPALELLQSLWHVHPNARLRRALNARIGRVRAQSESFLAPPRLAEGETA